MQSFPSTFTPALVAQCVESDLPPVLFHDMAALQPHLPRYVRVHPGHRRRLCDAGYAAMHAALVTQADIAALPVAALCADACKGNKSEDVVALRYGVACALEMSVQDVKPVAWLPCDAFALPRGVALRRLTAVRQGVLIAMDAASMAAVLALRPRQGDRVLDLCCAPGMKLCLIADAVTCSSHDDTDEDSRARGLVVGVDASLDRLYVTRSLVQRHQGNALAMANICLFLGDGRLFNHDSAIASCTRGEPEDKSIDPVTPIAAEACKGNAVIDVRDGLTTVERRKLRRRHRTGNCVMMDTADGRSSAVHVVYAPPTARAALQSSVACAAFDRVLVDVECTHDGSLAHVAWPTGKTNTSSNEANDTSTAVRADQSTDKPHGINNARRMRRMHLARGNIADPPAAASYTTSTCERMPLTRLQYELLCNGYAQLRPGGTLVYATCAFSYAQNEAIVRDFVHNINAAEDGETQQRHADDRANTLQGKCKTRAVLVPPFSYDLDRADSRPLAPCMTFGTNGHTASDCGASLVQAMLEKSNDAYSVVTTGAARSVTDTCECPNLTVPAGRFWPHAFRTSFLFVAKIVKQCVE